MISSTAALQEALRRTENVAAMAQSSVTGWEAKRKLPFLVSVCSNFELSCLFEDERCLLWLHLSALVDFCVKLLQGVVSGAAFSMATLACASCVICELLMMDVKSSGTSSDDENEEHKVENPFLKVAEQSRSGMLTDSFLEDWVLARVAVRCRLALDLLCQEMQDAWQSEAHKWMF